MTFVTNNRYRIRRSLSGKHVLITGGSSGIGKCVAVAAVEMGADVTIVARNEARLAKAREEIQAKVGSQIM